jgi:hypothetical protein
LEAFLAPSIRSVGKADQAYKERQTEILEMETSGMISAVTDGNLNKMVEETAPKDLPQRMRDDLSRVISLNRGGPLKTPQVAAAYLRAVGRRAEIEGRPELLDFAFIPDENGIAVADNPDLAEEVRTYRNRAEANRDDLKNRYDEQMKDFIAGKKSELNLALHNVLSNEEMTEQERKTALSALEAELYKYGVDRNNPEGCHLDNTFVRTYGAALRSVRSLKGFNTVDNGDALIRIEERGSDLTLEDIQRETGNITKSTYQKYMSRLAALTKKQMTKEGREALKLENEYKKPAMRGLYYQNPLGPIFNPYPNAAQRYGRGITLWNQKVEEAEVKLQDGEYLKGSDYEKIMKEVIDQVNLELPAQVEAGMPSTTTGTTPKVKGNAGQQKNTPRDKISKM